MVWQLKPERNLAGKPSRYLRWFALFSSQLSRTRKIIAKALCGVGKIYTGNVAGATLPIIGGLDYVQKYFKATPREKANTDRRRPRELA